jgi:hypothetical protein
MIFLKFLFFVLFVTLMNLSLTMQKYFRISDSFNKNAIAVSVLGGPALAAVNSGRNIVNTQAGTLNINLGAFP